MNEQIKDIMAQAKVQVDEQWPKGEAAPIFEELLSEFKELITYVAGEYYGFDPNDEYTLQRTIDDLMSII